MAVTDPFDKPTRQQVEDLLKQPDNITFQPDILPAQVMTMVSSAFQIIENPGVNDKLMNYDEAFARTQEFEGGGRTHTVSGDPGGTTKWGISQRAHPDLDIANLTEEDAKQLLKNDYWDPVRADLLPDELRHHVFDAAMNMGVEKASRLLQQAINLHGVVRGTEQVDPDGVIGPRTIQAVDSLDANRLTTLFRHLRRTEYVRLAKAGRGKFLFGWLKRA